MTGWTFLTNHGHVLLHVAMNPEATTRDIAAAVGITERSCQRIVADLERDGYIERVRVGRRNRYTVNLAAHLRHPMNRDHVVGELVDVLAPVARRASTG